MCFCDILPSLLGVKILTRPFDTGEEEEEEEEECVQRKVSDRHMADYLETMAQRQLEEWELLGSDYIMVLSDCPEKSNEIGKGPFSYNG